MEFHEKLQELRKKRGLTQEELAEALFVSRTAISKWESGRGYPSIDSLKQIAGYFSVSIDDLLSGDKLLSIAEEENKSNIQNMCHWLIGIMDICAIALIVLPLYPDTVDGFVYSVNLFQYTEISEIHRLIYWIIFVALIIIGVIKILLTKFRKAKEHKMTTIVSLTLSIIGVLYLAMRREAYAITVIFMLLMIKCVLLSRGNKK